MASTPTGGRSPYEVLPPYQAMVEGWEWFPREAGDPVVCDGRRRRHMSAEGYLRHPDGLWLCPRCMATAYPDLFDRFAPQRERGWHRVR